MLHPKSLNTFFFFSGGTFGVFSFFLSACEDLIRADRDSWCSRMRIRWGGDTVSNHHNLFIFTFTAPISLTVCLPWQWLFSDQLCIALASAPSLYSAHSGCIPACCQPTGCSSGRERERERGLDEEGGQRLQKANIQEEKVYKSVWGKLLIWAEVIGWMHIEATIVTVVPSLCKLLKTLSLTHILLYQLMTLQSHRIRQLELSQGVAVTPQWLNYIVLYGFYCEWHNWQKLFELVMTYILRRNQELFTTNSGLGGIDTRQQLQSQIMSCQSQN